MKLDNNDLLKWINANIKFCEEAITSCYDNNEFNYFYGKKESLEAIRSLLITSQEEYDTKITFNTEDFYGAPMIEKVCHHMLSRDFNQEYPRRCLLCGEKEW